MRKKLDYLPPRKRQELDALVQIVSNYDRSIAMIILFGSFARDNWVEEKHEDNIHWRYQSDFDVLVLIQENDKKIQINLENDLQDILEQADNITTPVSIFVHSVAYVNEQLAEAQYFFSDIQREGILLQGENLLPRKRKGLDCRVRLRLAKEDFDFWFGKADDFYEQFLFAYRKGNLAIAAFLLHQVTERLYNTAQLVYSHYKPNTHDLRILRRIAIALDKQFDDVFLLDSTANKRLFYLLRSAYIDARYKKNFIITPEELAHLQQEVDRLKALVERLCQAKIASFANQAKQSQENEDQTSA